MNPAVWCEELRTFLLIADEDLQGDGRLHLHRHLVVVDQTEPGQLQSRLQVLVALELHLTEVMQNPAGLWIQPRRRQLNQTYY